MRSKPPSPFSLACGRHGLSLWLIAAAASVSLFLISPRHAASESGRGTEVSRARELYRHAVSDFDAGNLDTALRAFRESHELHPHSETQYNIACVLSRLGSYLEAITVFEQYLEQDEAIQPARRAQIDGELERLRSSLGRVVIQVVPPGATVLIDGEEVATTTLGSPAPVDPGAHVIQSRLEGYEVGTIEVAVEPGETSEVSLVLRPLPARIHIIDAPPGTIIEVDGTQFGEAPFEAPIEVFAGRHFIRANIEGFEISERVVDALPGADLRVDVSPGPALPYARLRFDGNEDAMVFVDGEPVGELPWEGEIASGVRQLAIDGEGLNRWEGTVTVRRGDLLEADVSLGNTASGPGLAWIWSLSAVALAAGALALGFGLGALDADRSYQHYAARIRDQDYDGRGHLTDLQELADAAGREASSFGVVCDVSWSVAAVSAVAALLMLAFRRPGEDGPVVDISPVDEYEPSAGDVP